KDGSLDNPGASFEIYSLDPGPFPFGVWKGHGPFPAPAFFPNAFWGAKQNAIFDGVGRLFAMDLDGDGLVDLVLPDRASTPREPKLLGYFSAKSSEGTTQPFAERGGHDTCIPHHVDFSKAEIRLVTDFDGDGLPDIVEIEEEELGGAAGV